MILVTDANDEAPRFTEEPYVVQVPEVSKGLWAGPGTLAPGPWPAPLGCPSPGRGDGCLSKEHLLPAGEHLPHLHCRPLHIHFYSKGMFLHHFPL